MLHASTFGSERAILGESPLMDGANQMLWAVDIDGRRVFAVSSRTGEQQFSAAIDGRVGSVMLSDLSHYVLLAVERSLICLNTETGERKTLAADLGPLAGERLNDCRSFGDFLYGGGKLESKRAGFFRVSPKGEVRQLFDDVQISNGFWIRNDRLYYVDSLDLDPGPILRIYPFDSASGEVGTPARVAVAVPQPSKPGITPAVLDGMWMDVEEKLWIAVNGAGCVLRVEPDTGEVLETVEVGTPEVTACCLHENRLYITTARERHLMATLEPDENAGRLFIADVGVKGLSPELFPWPEL